ncbi:MAG: response regulator [Candidatus Eremiobacterota bacterium]
MDTIKILLAEDDVLNRKIILAMLNKMGYKADAVKNGREVLEALEKEFYSVIFMDIYMPGMTGIEVTKHIREFFPKEKQPLIIAMTAGRIEGDRDACFSAGMNGYIHKPVNKETLSEAIENCKKGNLVGKFFIQEESEEQIFNKSEIMKRLSGDTDLIHDIVEMFISNGPLQFDKLKKALDGNDRERLKITAHTIKGSAKNVSAIQVASTAFEIEKKSGEESREEISLLIKKLEDSFYKFKEFVSRDYLSDEI